MNKDYATDVLSFPLETIGLENKLLGSIVINAIKAKEASQQLGHTIKTRNNIIVYPCDIAFTRL